EIAVLGSMLAENSAIPEIVSMLRADDFYLPSHRNVFETITALFIKGEAVDPIVIDARLRGQTDRPMLADMADWTSEAFPSMAKQHARLVKDASLRRQIVNIAMEIPQRLDSLAEDPLAIAGEIVNALWRLGQSSPKGFRSLADIA